MFKKLPCVPFYTVAFIKDKYFDITFIKLNKKKLHLLFFEKIATSANLTGISKKAKIIKILI